MDGRIDGRRDQTLHDSRARHPRRSPKDSRHSLLYHVLIYTFLPLHLLGGGGIGRSLRVFAIYSNDPVVLMPAERERDGSHGFGHVISKRRMHSGIVPEEQRGLQRMDGCVVTRLCSHTLPTWRRGYVLGWDLG